MGAAGLLIRRILYELLSEYEYQVDIPLRLKRGEIFSKLPQFLTYAATRQGCNAIVIIADSDDDCPRDLASKVSRIAANRNIGMPVAVVCPNKEYEAWFIASIEDIRGSAIGQRGVTVDSKAECPDDPETIRGAKGWLTRQMPKGMAYKPSLDQAPMTEKINLHLASRRSRSFRRMCSAVGELVSGIKIRDSESYASPPP